MPVTSTTGQKTAAKAEATAAPHAVAVSAGMTMVPLAPFTLHFQGATLSFLARQRYVTHADLKAAILACGSAVDVVFE